MHLTAYSRRVVSPLFFAALVFWTVASVAAAFAVDVSAADRQRAMDVLKGFVAAEQKGDMRAAGSYVDPNFMARVGRIVGKSGPEMVEFSAQLFDRHADKSTIKITPYFGNIVWEQTSAGRPYLKMPVQTFIDASGGLGTDGLMTYVVYKEGGNWYAIDLKPGMTYRMFRRAYEDFAGFKIYKFK